MRIPRFCPSCRLLFALVTLFGLLPLSLHALPKGQLRIYSVDVEGGQSTLIVAPSGDSLLIDTGWPGNNGRDALRIQAAMKDAGIEKIGHLLTTHYHRDHVGGLPHLIAKVPIGEFLDHGLLREESDVTHQDYVAYLKAIEGQPRRVLHPGDSLGLKGVSTVVVAVDGERIAQIPGLSPTPNAACAAEQPWPDDPTENARSIGFLLTFGRFTFLDLGDLTGQKELALVCPASPLPAVDLFLVSHHGLDKSNSSPLIAAIHPRVAIMNNGTRKGGSPEAWQRVHDGKGLETLWQIHTAEASDATHNVPEPLIANPQGLSDTGAYFKVAANSDGSFELTNTRTGATKTYPHPNEKHKK